MRLLWSAQKWEVESQAPSLVGGFVDKYCYFEYSCKFYYAKCNYCEGD